MSIFQIPVLGEPVHHSPLKLSTVYGDSICNFVSDDQKLRFNIFEDGFIGDEYELIEEWTSREAINSSFEVAGPREKIFFDPENTSCAIITCGGLCPGLNNVIRAIVMEMFYHYGVKRILGIRYGYEGLNPAFGHEPLELTPKTVSNIHELGGTVLGSSRGEQDSGIVVDELEKRKIDILFCIGGDGTQRGAHDIYTEIKRRGKKIAVVGIPKTIDNDIYLVEKTFGFETAFSKAAESIRSAHVEACGAYNGIGLVKLMGRHSGYIASYAALALSEVNFVLIPELPFDLKGENGFLNLLKKRLESRHHAVIVVAEGAGQEYFQENNSTDPSGNKRLNDIGMFLKDEIGKFMREQNISHSIKYIDPSYIIRSVPAVPNDAIFSSQLARYAVHAGMAGKTSVLVGWRKNVFVHIPIEKIINKRKTVNTETQFWLSVLEATGQPMRMVNEPRQF